MLGNLNLELNFSYNFYLGSPSNTDKHISNLCSKNTFFDNTL